MDTVHHPEARSWISPKVKLKSYFEEFKAVLEDGRPKSISTAKMTVDKKKLSVNHLRLLVETTSSHTSATEEVRNPDEPVPAASGPARLSDEMFQEIAQQCSLDNLRVAGEVPMCQQFLDNEAGEVVSEVETIPRYAFAPIPKAGAESLKCLQLQQDFIDMANTYDKEKRKRMSRYPGVHWFESAPPKAARGNRTLMENQMLVAVRIYRPFKKDLQQPTLSLNNTKFLQEFHLLGTNYLSQLRDLIKCPTDLMTGGDISNHPPWVKKVDPVHVERSKDSFHLKVIPIKKDEETQYLKKAYKSGFFFIEGCFYNDMRLPECIDYSQIIRSWAESDPKRKLGPFTTAKMEETKIEDLEIRFGYPYVYVHQGEHEHLLSFTEARLVSADDPQRLAAYPYERCAGIHHSRFCMMCSVNVAKWVTTENQRVPEDPFFYCDGCFRDFNYDDNDKKIGHFRAYNYVDVNAL